MRGGLSGRSFRDQETSRWFAEGFKTSPEPKIEIHRREAHSSPLFDPDDPDSARTLALVTDDPTLESSLPLFALDAPGVIGELADFVERTLLSEQADGR
jgi:molybdopterin-guanine dinucleotide biosynthesis protein